jgi:hypothetical protein
VAVLTRFRRLTARMALVPFILAITSSARSQPARSTASTGQVKPAMSALPVIDVSLDRIRRQLKEPPTTRESSQSSLLKLEYYVQVVGTPPPIDFFKDFNIGRASSVQYGGMTHAEFLRVTAPFWRKW